MAKVINVLNVSSGDLVGSRFNGFDWMDPFKHLGISSQMLVHWNHKSNDERVGLINPALGEDPLLRQFARAEYLLRKERGKENAKFSWSENIFKSEKFRNADIIHLQIVQDGTLDVQSISKILRTKPTVWTWHDPWPLTGHCIYPMDCLRFEVGCGECPDLERGFKVLNDFTRENRLFKKQAFNRNFTLHVASKWFADLINSDASQSLPPCKILPFGIDTERFRPKVIKFAKQILNIPETAFVIGIRAVKEPQKNFQLMQRALQIMPKDIEIYILTIQEKGMLNGLAENINVIEMGWTDSDEELSLFYSALDLFVMPSRFETFGLMALEASSSGIPVIAVEDSAVSEVVDLRNAGYGISGNSSKELKDKIIHVYFNRDDALIKGKQGRTNAIKNHDLGNFLESLKDVYQNTLRNFNGQN